MTEAIPAELRDRPQWVLWRFEERDGKRTKVPYQAGAPTRRAASTDPATWATFKQALAASERADGIGFVFAADDPYCGIDFDHCVDGDRIHPDVAALVEQLSSYTEFSPSGTGLHVITRAALNGGRKRTGSTPWGGEFESYDRGRFFCMTGQHVPRSPATISERQAALDAVRAAVFPPEEPPRTRAVGHGLNSDDGELLERARNARNGADAWLTCVFNLNAEHPITAAAWQGVLGPDGQIVLRRAGAKDLRFEPARAMNTPMRLIESFVGRKQPGDGMLPPFKAEHCRQISHVVECLCDTSGAQTEEQEAVGIVGWFLQRASAVEGLTTYGTTAQRYEAAHALRSDVEGLRYLVDENTGELVIAVGDLAESARKYVGALEIEIADLVDQVAPQLIAEPGFRAADCRQAHRRDRRRRPLLERREACSGRGCRANPSLVGQDPAPPT